MTATKAARKEMLMRVDSLCQYYQRSLEKRTKCGNISCCFLQVLKDADTHLLVEKYLVWFEKKSKHDQDGASHGDTV